MRDVHHWSVKNTRRCRKNEKEGDEVLQEDCVGKILVEPGQNVSGELEGVQA
jgi:hypothetical protein